jgi:hypothetical protein
VSESSSYDTLGRHFRTPAHPDVLVALGRANYTFLSLEETVVAILYDAQFLDLDQSRILTAGRKVDMLRSLAKRYRRSKNGKDVALIIDNAIRAFDDVRGTVRNRLFHAQPFTAGVDDNGDYLPGLAYTGQDKDTKNIVRATLADKPGDLLDLTETIEAAIDPLSAAREAVSALPVTRLT